MIAKLNVFRLDHDWVLNFLVSDQLEAINLARVGDLLLLKTRVESLIVGKSQDAFVLNISVDLAIFEAGATGKPALAT